jgi:hypothetical protein
MQAYMQPPVASGVLLVHDQLHMNPRALHMFNDQYISISVESRNLGGDRLVERYGRKKPTGVILVPVLSFIPPLPSVKSLLTIPNGAILYFETHK